LLAQDRTDASLIGSPWFAAMNGPAAINLFFVLSGFVLCWAFVTDGDRNRMARLFFKRLPRLAGLVVVTTLGSYALFRTGQYHFVDAAEISKSVWLREFGFSGWTPEFQPDLATAAYEGIATFFSPAYSYNGVLWTMHHGFLGGMLAMAFGVFLATVMGYRQATVWVVVALGVAVLCYASFLFPMVLGAILAFVLARYRVPLPMLIAVPILAAGLYLLGYVLPLRSYAWVAQVSPDLQPYAPTVLHSLGSALLIIAVLCGTGLYRGLDGGLWRLLGRISFPLYLVHPLVIFSASSALYLDLTAQGYAANTLLALMFAATLALSVLVSLPLAWMDYRWGLWLDGYARTLLPDDAQRADPPVAQAPTPHPAQAVGASNVVDLRPPPLARPTLPYLLANPIGRNASGGGNRG
jgi:peptidoglycan/LPS O-acetylase OafA/YrhL